MSRQKSEIKVEFDSYCEHEAQAAIVEVLFDFAKKINTDILFSFGEEDEVFAPYEENIFGLNIVSWGSPAILAGAKLYSAYGMKLNPRQRDSYLINGDTLERGVVIYDTEGFRVALVVGKTLYIPFRLVVDGGNDIEKILSLILDDYYLCVSHRISFACEMKRRTSLNQEGRFAKLYEEAESDKDYLEELDSFQKEIFESSQSVTDHARGIRQLLEIEKPTEGKVIFDIYDRLCEMSCSGKLNLQNGEEIRIPIGQIDIEHNGKTYDIGQFEVIIDLFRQNVYCKNITRRIEGYPHPNARKNGYMCLGDASYGFAVLLGNMEYVTVVSMIIEKIKTYNENKPFLEIENWPEKVVT